MPRKFRKTSIIALDGTCACGAADATNLVLNHAATASIAVVTPFDNMTFLGASIVQRAAGTGTGTFSLVFSYGSTPTTMSETTVGTFIDADAAAGTYQGYVDGGNVAVPSGQQIKLSTVKTGSVTGNATLEITMFFGLGA